jgi:glycosyltransferase involved in cell wall biosynthesis
MNITIYTFSYNEELLIEFMINHYRSRFPNCHIVIFDNSSTDKTVEIAKNNNCEIRYYETGNTLNDEIHMRIKNTCWKDAKTDWVLMCDLDELLNINFQELDYEQNIGTSIIKTECWSLVNLEDNLFFKNMKYGFRDAEYDKSLLFNKKHIQEINYGAGCHDCHPIGQIKYSAKPYIIYHYKYINEDLFVARSMLTAKRFSEDNLRNRWGYENLRPEQELRSYFKEQRRKAIKIL